MTDSEDYEQLQSVRLGSDGAAEMDRHRRIIFVPRGDILRLELSFGSAAERPAVLISLGLVLLVVAIASGVTVLFALTRGGVRIPASLVMGVAFVVPAWWLLDLSLRKRWYLCVHTRRGSRKLVFHEPHDRGELERFLERARRRFGYS